MQTILYFYKNESKTRVCCDVITASWRDTRGVAIENLLVGHVSFLLRY